MVGKDWEDGFFMGIAVGSTSQIESSGYGIGDTIKASNLEHISPIVWTVDAYSAGYPINVTVDDAGNVYTASSTGVRKYDSDGVIIWSNTEAAFAYDVAVDAYENVYVAYRNSLGTKTVRKLSSSGSEIWAKTDNSNANGIAVDADGNVYVAYDINTALAKTVRKLNSSGVEVWSRNDVKRATDIAVDTSGNVYVSYYTYSGVTSVNKLDSSGVELWAKTDGSSATGITVDSEDNVCVSYDMASTSGYSSIRKLNSSGVELWAKYDIGQAYGVTVDTDNNVYVIYRHSGSRKISSAGNDIWILPSRVNNAIATDSVGHAYITTYDGLVKFNSDLEYTIVS